MHLLINLGLAFVGLIALILVITIVFLALRSILTGIAIGLLEAPGFIGNVPNRIRSVPWRSKERFAWSDLLLIPAVLIGATFVGFIMGPILAIFGVR